MKKNDDLVTKKYLDKKLSKFKVELKSEIKEEIREELVEFSKDIQDRFDKTARKYKNELRMEVHEDIYQMKDELAGLIKSSQEEKDVHNFSHARINEELDDHDRRITQLQAAV